jgi:hypothetical protein
MNPRTEEGTMTVVELEYVCDGCMRPVADGDGALYLNFGELAESRRAKEQWDTSRDPSGRLDIVSLLLLPGLASWHIHHDACRPEGADGYDIAVERVRTWRDLVRWTAHLMEKNWLPHTNWRSLLGNAADARDRRIREAKVRGDAA